MHISDSTLSYLEGAYEVEPGGGEERSSMLKDHNVKTYFIKPKDMGSSARKQVSVLRAFPLRTAWVVGSLVGRVFSKFYLLSTES